MPHLQADLRPTVVAVLDDPSLLEMHVQPIFNLSDGSVAGWEALARPAAGLNVTPGELFAAATQAQLSVPLHEIAVAAALALRETVPHGTFLAFNVDPAALTNDRVRRILTQEDDLSGVFVEIVETAWPVDTGPLMEAFEDIRHRKGMLAVDDIGAGDAGLQRLLDVRPQMLKLDRQLASGLHVDAVRQALVAALGEMAASMDAWVCVEGLETAAQLSMAMKLGVPLGQGWILGEAGQPWPRISQAAQQEWGKAYSKSASTTIECVMLDSDEFGIHIDAKWHPLCVRMDLPNGQPWDFPAMTMGPGTAVDDALVRALSRTKRDRFVPICVTDESGALIGVVRVEDLAMRVMQETKAHTMIPKPRYPQ